MNRGAHGIVKDSEYKVGRDVVSRLHPLYIDPLKSVNHKGHILHWTILLVSCAVLCCICHQTF